MQPHAWLSTSLRTALPVAAQSESACFRCVLAIAGSDQHAASRSAASVGRTSTHALFGSDMCFETVSQ
jgi:hypothetical protein